MKLMSKRVLSWLLSLAMLVSLCSGLSLLPVQAESVDYVYAGNYVYNWGEREELATFLSPMAKDFYEDNDVTYADLAAYDGASSTSDVPYSELYRALHALMYGKLKNPTSYDGTKNLFQYTDCQNSGGKISSFYSGKEIGPSWNSDEWNREHTWPNSKSNGGSNSNTQRETDIMMLRPTAKSENGSRSNTPYGQSSDYYHPNEESGGKHDLRGDVSRIVLYVYTCWGGSDKHDGALNYMWGSNGVIESKEVLLDWIEADPVDTWEMGRNDSVQSITGTRNVFVDYPELAFELFNEDVPKDYNSPSGGNTVSYTVTASANNANYGTVSVDGRTITATPKPGYAVSGHVILSGTATVTREGNVFKVSPTSDVSIGINFAPRMQATVQFSQLSTIVGEQAAYVGDTVTLPAYSGTAPDGYTFVGWSDTTVEDTTKKPTCYTVGSSYAVNGAATLYALFSRFEGEGASDSNVYELVTDAADLQIGDKVVVYAVGKNVALSTTQNKNNRGQVDVVANDNSITVSESVQVITLEEGKKADTYAFNVGNGYLYAASSSSNHLKTETAPSENGSWSISIASTGVATIKAQGTNTRNWMRYNSQSSLFACYSTGQADIALYKQSGGTTYYFTDCDHVYDTDFDMDCNVCGAVRVVDYDLFTYGGLSVSEDVNGIAFRYTVAAHDMSLDGHVGNYTTATITPNSAIADATLVMMGAVASNDPTVEPTLENMSHSIYVIDIPALRFIEVTEDTATYAVRIIDIPDAHKDAQISVRPYYIYVDDDKHEIVCYGDVQSASYNSLM